MILKCKTGEYEVTAALFEAYAAIYPTAEQSFAQMVIWLEANPSRRPASQKSAPRFVANWFKRVPKRTATKFDARGETISRLIGGLRSDLAHCELLDGQMRRLPQ